MNEGSTAGTNADLQLGPVGGPSPLGASALNGAYSAEAGPPEDPSVIKCICGYNDDDGNTVLCEICNTWQHIECYYPNQTVPDVHECYDDRPRTLDAKGARERQTQLRELHVSEDRRIKRPKSSTHRKKTKDSVSLNGWPLPEAVGDRPSDNPRDQQPPTKRPKTSHKASSSVTSLNHASIVSGTARRKTGPLGQAQSPVRSPPELNGYSGGYFSPEFMSLQRDPQYQHAEGNLMTSIGVTNDLALWVQDPDELAKATRAETPSKVFWRIDSNIEELAEMCPGITRHADEDKTILINGVHPLIQRMTVDAATPAGAFIGELRGRISRRTEYMQDPANRWPTLRHPAPFVFFPPHLPIALDARHEGTELRYVRRSCKPNTKMRIVIDRARDYHFCLVSDLDLNEGEEITLAWHMDEDVMHILATLTSNGSLKKEGIHGEEEHFICTWASRVLANFGGCACGNPSTCLLGRFDRRASQQLPDFASAALKLPKARKGKKGANHASPLSTGKAVNSRASSEAANTKNDNADDRGDSRSVSGSSKSKPTSRDNTPGVFSADLEISGREKRKLEQLERRFDALGQDDTPGRKKKRNSAGSALNTPGPTTSKQLGLGFHDPQHPPSAFAPMSKHSMAPGSNGLNGHITESFRPGSGSNGMSPIQVRTYIDASTQTDIGAQNSYNTALAPCKRRRISYSQRILARTRDEKPRPQPVQSVAARTNAVQPLETAPASSSVQDSLHAAQSGPSMLPPPRPPPNSSPTEAVASSRPVSHLSAQIAGDLELHDAAAPSNPTHDFASPVPASESTAAQVTEMALDRPVEAAEMAGQDPVPEPVLASSTRPNNLHVTLPPIPNFSPPTPTTPSVTATPGSIDGSSIVQSPVATSAALPLAPLASPATPSSAAPTASKKKLSLSDYSRRRAAAKEAAAQPTGPPAESKPLSSVAEGGRGEEGAEAREDEPMLQRVTSVAVEDSDIPLPPIKDAAQEAQIAPADVPVVEDAADAQLKAESADAAAMADAEAESKTPTDAGPPSTDTKKTEEEQGDSSADAPVSN